MTSPRIPKLGCTCLEPTYEGLKQAPPEPEAGEHRPFGAYLRGIETCYTSVPCRGGRESGLEPTYEGLKLAQLEEAEAQCAGLEPTYEGLKLEDPTSLSSGSVPVWSLPTRD